MTNATLDSMADALQMVLAGTVSYSVLQRLVDSAVIEGKLPDGLPPLIQAEIYELQTVLELIAEHQATHLGTSSFYTGAEIVAMLAKFASIGRT